MVEEEDEESEERCDDVALSSTRFGCHGSLTWSDEFRK